MDSLNAILATLGKEEVPNSEALGIDIAAVKSFTHNRVLLKEKYGENFISLLMYISGDSLTIRVSDEETLVCNPRYFSLNRRVTFQGLLKETFFNQKLKENELQYIKNALMAILVHIV